MRRSRSRTRRDERIDQNKHRLDAVDAPPAPEIITAMSSTAAPYQGGGWTDRLLNRGFAFVHIWSHFVQLAAFIAPPFYLLAKVLDLPIIPTGTAFGMGLNVILRARAPEAAVAVITVVMALLVPLAIAWRVDHPGDKFRPLFSDDSRLI